MSKLQELRIDGRNMGLIKDTQFKEMQDRLSEVFGKSLRVIPSNFIIIPDKGIELRSNPNADG